VDDGEGRPLDIAEVVPTGQRRMKVALADDWGSVATTQVVVETPLEDVSRHCS
jgi:hypothetical protein